MTVIDPVLAARLVCPRDHRALSLSANALSCDVGHSYPVIDGVPVMLVDDVAPTIDIAAASRRAASSGNLDESGLYLDTLSLSDDEKRGIAEMAREGQGAIDPVVAYLVAATNGLMYKHLIGRLERYPIPVLPMPPQPGRTLLDVGCSWGRWTLAASQAGYQAIGIDPSLGAVMAARRVARHLNQPTSYLVADARFLPFAPASVDAVFSYSVIQHLSRDDAARAVGEIGRVLREGGGTTVQMPARFGVRCLYHQARRGFREGRGFDVRYWTLPALRRLFASAVGSTTFDVDGYFGIGLQRSDEDLMPPRLAMVLRTSDALKSGSRWFPPLVWAADSVFVRARKDGPR